MGFSHIADAIGIADSTNTVSSSVLSILADDLLDVSVRRWDSYITCLVSDGGSNMFLTHGLGHAGLSHRRQPCPRRDSHKIRRGTNCPGTSTTSSGIDGIRASINLVEE